VSSYGAESGSNGRGRDLIFAAVVLVLALSTSFLAEPSQQRISAALQVTVLRPFIATQERLEEARIGAAKADSLITLVDSLSSQLSTQSALVDENRTLRSLLQIAERAGPKYLPATVLRPGTPGSESMFLVDVGAGDSIAQGSPVVSPFGLVGVIREVRSGNAVGMDWTHPDFRASAMVADGSVYGLVENRPGDFREADRLLLNGIPFTIVGVAPEGFTGISPVEPAPDVWVPLAMFGTLHRIDPADSAWWARHPRFLSRWLDVVGRVADGVTLEAAESELVSLADALEHPHKGEQESVMVTRQFLYRPSQEASLTSLSTVLLTVVGIVLLVAASNVAVLLLSRATTRYREIGIRTAMGAGRGRIVRQLVAESVLLGALGGTLGVALAFLFSGAAGSLLPLPFETSFVPDARVLMAAAGLTVLTSVVVGLAPALHSVRRDVTAVIEHGGPGFGARRSAGGFGGTGAYRARDVLVVSQVALSLVLVTGAFLFARSFEAASGEELGFDDESVLVTRVGLQSLGYGPDDGRVFLDDALERLEAIRGVRSASTTNRVPFQGDWSTEIPAPEGATPNAPDGHVTVGLNAVAAGYFDLMGIEILAGRGIAAGDRSDAEPVIVVNETLAELLWPGADPVGRIFPELSRPYRVVGVARDATYYELGEDPRTQAYFSVQQSYQPTANFIVRSEGDASRLAGPVQATLRDIDPDLAFAMTTTLEAVVDEELARYEVSAVLVGLFGFIALVLATAGLYGVVAFAVSRRTREIGVRMALGADRRDVAGSVLRSGLRLAAVGVVLGLAGAFALRGFTESLLYGIAPTDPLPLVVSSVALLAVAAAASLVPARRATRVDPVEAIRAE